MTERKKYNVKLINNKDFGKLFDLRSVIPKDCNAIIVCTNDGTGLVPRRLLLPHQLYLKDVNKLLKDLVQYV